MHTICVEVFGFSTFAIGIATLNFLFDRTSWSLCAVRTPEI
jgi:hypothetical protein